ncbi:MAG: FliM/FliN family flagellar motor switch protein [Planctomycetota bacterium]
MASIDSLDVELTVVVGSAEMPLHRLLSLGRGAVVPLGGDATRPLKILANGLSVAEGAVALDGERVNVHIAGRD